MFVLIISCNFYTFFIAVRLPKHLFTATLKAVHIQFNEGYPMKVKSVFLIVCLVLVAAFATTVVRAQAEPIEYGETVTGELANNNFEFEYTFKGSEGDIIIIDMRATDFSNDVDDPQIDLLDSEGNLVLSTADQWVFNWVRMGLMLPADDDYTIIATRKGGRGGSSVGEFQLTLMVPPVLTLDEIVAGSLVSDDPVSFYAVMLDEAFDVAYARTGGDMAPEIKVSQADPRTGEIRAVGRITGEAVSFGMLGTFEPDTVYFVEVDPGWSFRRTLEYEVAVIAAAR